jgi:AcrR family transcriptional regulator
MPNPIREKTGREEALRELRQDLRRNEILEAAQEIFETSPYDEVSMAQIADAAGVSRSTLYVYFPNREAIFGGMLEQGQIKFARQFQQAIERTGDFQDRLKTMVVSILNFLSAHHSLYEKIISPGFRMKTGGDSSQTLENITQHSRELLRGVIRSGIEDGALPEHDVMESSWVLETLLHGTVGPRLTDAQFPMDIERASELVCLYFLTAVKQLNSS